jgi:hypothetical protein
MGHRQSQRAGTAFRGTRRHCHSTEVAAVTDNQSRSPFKKQNEIVRTAYPERHCEILLSALGHSNEGSFRILFSPAPAADPQKPRCSARRNVRKLRSASQSTGTVPAGRNPNAQSETGPSSLSSAELEVNLSQITPAQISQPLPAVACGWLWMYPTWRASGDIGGPV